MTSTARGAAALIALVAGITLLARLYLSAGIFDSYGKALAHLSQFFTILTNTIILVLMTLIAAGRNPDARLVKAAVIAIIVVGLVYHWLLAHLVELSGLTLLVDHGVHTIVPLLCLSWWIAWAPKPGFFAGDLLLWIAWPVIYCIYILVRASGSGFYPYPFLDLPEIGWTGLATNVVGLTIGFIVIGLILTAIGRVTGPRAGAR